MATREFVEGRLSAANEKLAKKLGTIERHKGTIEKKYLKIEKLGFDRTTTKQELRSLNNEAYWLAYDIESLNDSIKDIEKMIEKEIKPSIQKYQTMLDEIVVKENSRNVQVIIDFLNEWKRKCVEYYKSLYESYNVDFVKWRDEDRHHTLWYNGIIEGITPQADIESCKAYNYYPSRSDMSKDEIKNVNALYKNHKKTFYDKYRFIIDLLGRDDEFEDVLDKVLENEKWVKYDDLVSRVTEITGTITDASALSIGNQAGELNGIIVGENGKVRVETIGAGGYNIQCYHYRVLIHRI